MSGNFAIKGGGAGPLMANAILNFHFDYLNPSLRVSILNRTKCLFLRLYFSLPERHRWQYLDMS